MLEKVELPLNRDKEKHIDLSPFKSKKSTTVHRSKV